MINGKGKKIALIGCAPSSVKLAPYYDEEWEIWACSANQALSLPRFDVWFEIHCLDVPSRISKLSDNYVAWMATQKRVVMQEHDPRIPGSVAYPLDEVRKVFGCGSPFIDSFLSSSFSLMVALALMQRPPAIGCWGFDLHHESEYAYQRPGFHFFCWQANQMQVPIFSSPETDILQPMPVYGFRERSPMWRRYEAHRVEHQARIDDATRRLEEAKRDVAMHRGALEHTLIIQQCWTGMRNEMVKPLERDDGTIATRRLVDDNDAVAP